MSDNVEDTNNQEDLLCGVATLFDVSSSGLPQRDQTQDMNLPLRVGVSNQDDLQVPPNVPNLGLGLSQRDQTQDSNLPLRVGDWFMASANSDQGDLQLPPNLANLGPGVSQRDQTQDMNLSTRADWSMASANSNQDDLQLLPNVPNLGPGLSQRDQTQYMNLPTRAFWSMASTNSDQDDLQLSLNVPNPGPAIPQRDPAQDLELISRVCDCGWSQVATYRDLKNHQADKGCTRRPEVNQSNQQNLFQNPPNVPTLGAGSSSAMSQRKPRLDPSVAFGVAPCSMVSTYPDLNSHQAAPGRTPRSEVNHSDVLTDTASAKPPPSEVLSLEQQLTCSICMNLFVDPITTACGHSFCKGCLDYNCQSNDRLCPLCKQIVRRTPLVNIVLRNVAEEMKKIQQRSEAKVSLVPGEVACDICTKPKLKAEKSCLVCLASYCSTHLENHSSAKRLKGHKLVEPVKNLDERACLEHGRPLELYNRKTEKCICARCLEEGQEEVVSTEDEWNNKKTKLQNTKEDLQEEIKKRKKRVVEIDESLKSCKDKLDNEWWDIDAVFTTVINIMEEAHASALKPLTERREVLEKDAKDIKDELEAEIDRLEKTISELDDISALEDHILFLQRYPSLQDTEDHKDSTKVELDTSLSFGTMRKTTMAMLDRIQLELERLASTEIQRLPKFKVDVKLDPSTAHRRLVLSDDGREVRDGGGEQEVDDSPERFNLFGSILGINRLTGGRSYWEVEVSNKSGWDLGVTTGDANRKGKLTLDPDNGYWVAVHYEDEKYAAMTTPPVRLSLKKKPQRVGVFVDYEEGLVSFYDVRAQSHIFSFTNCLFGEDLFPYFSPHAQKDEGNADPLVISAVEHQDVS